MQRPRAEATCSASGNSTARELAGSQGHPRSRDDSGPSLRATPLMPGEAEMGSPRQARAKLQIHKQNKHTEFGC